MRCRCVDEPCAEPTLHLQRQDEGCPGWQRVLTRVDEVADNGEERFALSGLLQGDEWSTVITLPKTIARLTRVKTLFLYGTALVRIPPEIGAMAALESIDLYTSYGIHWLPFEITHCRNLKDSTFSTRALYGNCKTRMPFPALPHDSPELVPPVCSVCRGPFSRDILQAWISLRVATDVLPLLVHACSQSCLDNLPAPAQSAVQFPHQGGPRLEQPASIW